MAVEKALTSYIDELRRSLSQNHVSFHGLFIIFLFLFRWRACMGSQGMGVRLGASGSWVGSRIACNGRSKNSFRLASWVIECNAHLQN